MADLVIWISIYSPRSSHKKSSRFRPQKALLHNQKIIYQCEILTNKLYKIKLINEYLK